MPPGRGDGILAQVHGSQKFFQRIDVHGCIVSGAGAIAFTAVRAYSAGYCRKRHSLPQFVEGRSEFCLLQQIVDFPDIGARRACAHTGRDVFLPGIQAEDVQRACFETDSATCTLCLIQV